MRKLANENDPPFAPANYWQDLAAGQEKAGLVIEIEKVKLAIAEHGGSKAVVVFDQWEADQIHFSHMYLGYASPANNNELVHVHHLQTKFYVIQEGTAEMWMKHYWNGNDNCACQVLNRGDIAIVWPQTRHFFKWRSPQGIAVITKAPNNLGGVGRPPAAKLTCTNFPRFKKGCDGLTAP